LFCGGEGVFIGGRPFFIWDFWGGVFGITGFLSGVFRGSDYFGDNWRV